MLYGAGKDDVAGFAATLPYVAEPETRWNYNSGASNLLARLVRETLDTDEAGMRAFMKRELFDRIGMDDGRSALRRRAATSSARPPATAAHATTPASATSTCATASGDGERILPEGWVGLRAPPRHRSRAASTARTSGRFLAASGSSTAAARSASASSSAPGSTWSSSGWESRRRTRSAPWCATARSWSTPSGRPRGAEVERGVLRSAERRAHLAAEAPVTRSRRRRGFRLPAGTRFSIDARHGREHRGSHPPHSPDRPRGLVRARRVLCPEGRSRRHLGHGVGHRRGARIGPARRPRPGDPAGRARPSGRQAADPDAGRHPDRRAARRRRHPPRHPAGAAAWRRRSTRRSPTAA